MNNVHYLNENERFALASADDAARIAEEYTVTPEFLREVINGITSSYEHGFKEVNGQYYDNSHDKDLLYKAASYVREFLKERGYIDDIRVTDTGIIYYIRWDRVMAKDSQQNQ